MGGTPTPQPTVGPGFGRPRRPPTLGPVPPVGDTAGGCGPG